MSYRTHGLKYLSLKPIYGESPFKEAVKEIARQVEIDRIRNSRK